MMRPELMEIKTHIKSLKKEAEMRLTLDVEAQQSFEFLSDQVQGLRKAFSTLSDVLIEEVDLIRSEAATRHEEVAEKLSAQAKGLKAARTDLTLLRSEAQAARATHQCAAETRRTLIHRCAIAARNRCTALRRGRTGKAISRVSLSIAAPRRRRSAVPEQ